MKALPIATFLCTRLIGKPIDLPTHLRDQQCGDAGSRHRGSTGSGSNGNGAGTGYIEKFVLSSGTYVLDGSVAVGNTVTGVTTEQLTGVGGTFDAVFATTPSTIYEISETGGSLTGDTLNTAATAATNTAFRGLAADTAATTVPEPAAVSTLLFAGAGMLLYRRRGRLISA